MGSVCCTFCAVEATEEATPQAEEAMPTQPEEVQEQAEAITPAQTDVLQEQARSAVDDLRKDLEETRRQVKDLEEEASTSQKPTVVTKKPEVLTRDAAAQANLEPPNDPLKDEMNALKTELREAQRRAWSAEKRVEKLTKALEEGPSDYHIQEGGRFAKALERETMAVIKAQYFQDCLAKKEPFEHRANIPSEAIWDGPEIAKLWYKYGFKTLVVVSYSWLSNSHPDPELFHLPTIVHAVDEMKKKWGMTPGIILDYTSFYHGTPRTPEQELSFKECLSLFHLPFGHPDVTALKLINVPDGEQRGYDSRGWTKFASDIIDSKPPSPKDGYGELNVLTCDGESRPFSTMSKTKRRPPVTPERFLRELMEREECAKNKGFRLFTAGKDQPLILELYTESFRAIAKGVEKLYYEGMGLGPAEALVLAEALPHLLLCKELILSQNNLGDEGVAAISKALPAGLESLYLIGNQIGDEGARALAEALPVGLKTLWLSRNQIGDEGARALAEALPVGLETLRLEKNQIGDEGARALAEALPAGLLRLHLESNQIGDEGARALAQAKRNKPNLTVYGVRGV